jgi:hypothetical protein
MFDRLIDRLGLIGFHLKPQTEGHPYRPSTENPSFFPRPGPVRITITKPTAVSYPFCIHLLLAQQNRPVGTASD